MQRLLCGILLLGIGGCALGSGTAGYALRAKTAAELTSEAEDRVVQKSVKATVEYLRGHQWTPPAESPQIPPGQSGIEGGM